MADAGVFWASVHTSLVLSGIGVAITHYSRSESGRRIDELERQLRDVRDKIQNRQNGPQAAEKLGLVDKIQRELVHEGRDEFPRAFVTYLIFYTAVVLQIYACILYFTKLDAVERNNSVVFIERVFNFVPELLHLGKWVNFDGNLMLAIYSLIMVGVVPLLFGTYRLRSRVREFAARVGFAENLDR